MSRIGNLPITLPQGVSVSVAGSDVTAKGGLGTLTQYVHPDIKVNVQDQSVSLVRPTNKKRHKALHGLYRSLIHNMVIGVSKGYKKELELVGVGYKADAKADVLELSLGYSHGIYLKMPEEVKVTTETVKGKNPKIILESINKELIGSVAAKIRSLRKVEPYKGKGVRFVGEQIRKKAGKTAAK